MRGLLDSLICTLVTLFMFAFPMTLLGFAPWFGDSLIGYLRVRPDGGLSTTLVLVSLMIASSAALCLFTMPIFALAYRPVSWLARFGTRLVSELRPAYQGPELAAETPLRPAARTETGTPRAEAPRRPRSAVEASSASPAQVQTSAPAGTTRPTQPASTRPMRVHPATRSSSPGGASGLRPAAPEQGAHRR